MKRTAFLLISLYMGLVGASAQEDRCDVNGDGVVNIADVIYVVDHVLGKHEPQSVDLGLPSGTKWASYNVGATKPEEYGGYYAWGETEEKEVYYESNYEYYKYGSYVDLGHDIGGTEYDVAHVKWGGNWVMPTFDDIAELDYYCTHEWTTLNGVNGCKFTSKINGNSIFLPAAGRREGGELIEVDYYGIFGHYSSSTECKYPYGEEDEEGNYHEFFIIYDSYALWVDQDGGGLGEITRWCGSSVRPVWKE